MKVHVAGGGGRNISWEGGPVRNLSFFLRKSAQALFEDQLPWTSIREVISSQILQEYQTSRRRSFTKKQKIEKIRLDADCLVGICRLDSTDNFFSSTSRHFSFSFR